MLASQPLFVNCYSQMQPVMMPQPHQQLPQYSPYQQFYHLPAQTQPMPIGVSPGSSGRFDAGYDSDASGSFAAHGGGSPAEMATAFPASPVIYCQPPLVQQVPPPPPPCTVEPSAWRDKFEANFSRFPIGAWHLKIVSQPPDMANSGFARHLWRYHLAKARVNFVCTACRSSTNATGQAVFWIYKDDASNTGHIRLKLYGQKCPQCQSPAEASWHPHEAGRALDGLFEHVAQHFYGAQQRTAAAAAPAGQRSGRSRGQQSPVTRLPNC